MRNYNEFNEYAKDGGIVIFGSSYASSIPFCELARDFETGETVYNRSIEGLVVADAENYLDQCIVNLNPAKVFISIGDEDMKDPFFDAESFIEKYQWLLYTLHSRCNAKIYIVSVVSKDYRVHLVNDKLKKIAKQSGCQYVDCTGAAGSNSSAVRFFDVLRFYMRSRPISFGQAFSLEERKSRHLQTEDRNANNVTGHATSCVKQKA